MNTRHLILLLVTTTWFPCQSAVAQRGSLIEDLFRTVAEAQLERQRQKRNESPAVPNRSPQLTPEFTPGRPNDPITIPSPRLPSSATPNRKPSIDVRSPELASFAESLSQFTRELGFLVTDLRGLTSQNPGLRAVLPPCYQSLTESKSLLRSCDGLARFDPIIDRYRSLDAGWRSLSFQLRSTPGLNAELMSHVRLCDRMISKMERQLNVSPQLDRHALHDKMIIAATYMQTLLDDLQLCDLPANDRRKLTHDGRLLRQELLRTADVAETISYEDLSTRFTEFVGHWRSYSGPVYSLGDRHVNRRLDRISELGEETYALLWMRPPVSAVDLSASASSLKRALSDLMDQLTLRSLAPLDPATRTRVDELTRRMYRHARELDRLASHRGDQREMQSTFAGFDRDWVQIRDTFARMPKVSRRIVAAIDRESEHLRRTLRVAPAGPPSIRYDQLIEIAASLEGSSEYLLADIRRYERYLKPSSFRRSISSDADDFYDASKRLHRKLHDRDDVRSLSKETDKLVTAWQSLSTNTSRLRTNGLSGGRAIRLEQTAQGLAPQVARIAAALLQP